MVEIDMKLLEELYFPSDSSHPKDELLRERIDELVERAMFATKEVTTTILTRRQLGQFLDGYEGVPADRVTSTVVKRVVPRRDVSRKAMAELHAIYKLFVNSRPRSLITEYLRTILEDVLVEPDDFLNAQERTDRGTVVGYEQTD